MVKENRNNARANNPLLIDLQIQYGVIVAFQHHPRSNLALRHSYLRDIPYENVGIRASGNHEPRPIKLKTKYRPLVPVERAQEFVCAQRPYFDRLV